MQNRITAKKREKKKTVTAVLEWKYLYIHRALQKNKQNILTKLKNWDQSYLSW